MRQPTPGSVRSAGAPPSLDTRIAQVASRQHAAITIVQLVGIGLTDGGVTRRVQRGALHRRHRGVYVVGQPTLSEDGERMAAVLAAGPGSGLSHVSATELYGVSRFRAPLLQVCSPRFRRLDGVRVHKVRRIDARDLTTHRGIPVTTIHRTQVDLTDVLTPHQLANFIHEAAFRGRFVEPAVRDSMARANGRHNLHVLERAIALHHSGSPGTKSAGEDAFLALFGDDEPLVNLHVEGRQVDFHWPDRRLVVEVDGSGHGRTPTRLDDAERDRTLQAAGWTVSAVHGHRSLSSGPTGCGTRRCARFVVRHIRARDSSLMARRLLAVSALLGTTLAFAAILLPERAEPPAAPRRRSPRPRRRRARRRARSGRRRGSSGATRRHSGRRRPGGWSAGCGCPRAARTT